MLQPVPEAALAYFAARRSGDRARAVGDESRENDPGRHRTLLSLAGSMRNRGMSGDEIAVALLAVNARRCRPPLPEQEVAELAHDVGRRYQPKPPDPEEERIAEQARRLLEGAREELIKIEAGGPDAKERAEAEKRVAKAQQAAAEPWRERIAGAERAALDGRHAIQRHAAEHLDELVCELEEAGSDAAEQVDAAAESFVDAVARHAAVERALIQTVALTRHVGPNDVSRPRSGEAVHAMRAFLSAGRERGPAFRRERLPEPGHATADDVVGVPA